MEISIDQLKNYLGTGLEIRFKTTKGLKYHKLAIDNFRDVIRYTSNYNIICYRLSNLDKEIVHNGERFVPLEKLRDTFKFATTGYVDFDMNLDLQVEPFKDAGDVGDVFINMLDSMAIMQLLFEWHFWPFGDEYFEQGLVIDKMKNVC